MDEHMIELIREKLEEHERSLTEYGVRLMNVEETTREIRDLTKSVQQIAEKQNYIGEKIEGLTETVKELDRKPKDKWDKVSWAVMGTIITTVVAGLVGIIMSTIH